MKMKFYNLVLLTTAFVALLFLYYVKKSFDWLVGWEEEVIPIEPPEIAIVKEMQMINDGNYDGLVSYPDIPVMIWWTPFTGDDGLQQCGQYKCFFTNDRAYRHHPMTRTMFFYGTDFKPYDVPIPRKPGEDWALFHEESPKNNPIFSHPEVMSHFNHTSTLRQTSHFPLTTQYLESIQYITDSRLLVPVETKNRLQRGEGLAPVAYVQSGCDTPSMRDSWVAEFMKHIPVDSYGSCLNNKQLPSDIAGSEQFENEKFLKFLAQYKFVISFENAICDDYVTEKLWRTLRIGSVPIYLGAPNVETLLPNKNSAILVKNFKSPKDVADYIATVNEDDKLYNSFLKHKSSADKSFVENQLLTDLLKSRRWGVSSRQQRDQGNFIAHYQCHVCQEVASNIKYSRLGFRPRVHKSGDDHYGCPAPVSPITGETDPSSWWTDLWNRSKKDAWRFDKLATRNKQFSKEQFYSEN